jgi:hypothetical protein
MKKSSPMIGLLLLALVGGAACEHTKARTTPDAGATPGQTVSGGVDPAVQGEGLMAAIIWEVSSGPLDYTYKFGEGIVTNGRYSITLSGDPPTEAINSFGVGIAVVMVLAQGVTLPDGKLEPTALSTDIVGISARNSVIWRAKTLNLPESGPPPDWWPLGFPQGLACGVCTPRPDGGSFDGFAPTACDQLQVNLVVTENVCNWT